MASAPPAAGNGTADFQRALVRVVDNVPETNGIGVLLVAQGRLHRLRNPDPGEATVVFELRQRPSGIPFLPSGPSRPSPLMPGASASPGPWPRPVPRAAAAPAAQPQRTAASSPATEWINLGFNCGGAVLAWIGVAGLSALTPVTGGLSAPGAVLMYGGALASSGQCVVSVARTANVHRGRADINQRWDNSPTYVWTMRGADAVGLLGAGGALRELRATNAALRRVGFSMDRARQGQTMSRRMRRELTTAMGLQGGPRASSAVINSVVRQKLLEGAGGAVGMAGSAFGGILREVGGKGWDIVVWITEARDLGR